MSDADPADGALTDIDWQRCRQAFQAARRLQVSIADTGLDDWLTLIGFLQHTDAVLAWRIDKQPIVSPADIRATLLECQQACALTVQLDGITLHCEPGTPGIIRLWFDAVAIDSETKARVIFRLMSTAGRTLDRQVILSAEGAADRAIFSYTPGAGLASRLSDTPDRVTS